MADENTENLDSEIEEVVEGALDGLSEEELKEKLAEKDEKNKQLFARAKKAEGFVLQDGKWVKPEPKEEKEEAPVATDVPKVVQEELDRRDLNSLAVSDSLKEEIKSYAKLKGVSVQEALKSDYIQFRKGQDDKEQEAENASLGGKNKGNTKIDYSEASPSDFDLTTEEGRKDWAAYKEWLKKG